MSHFFRDHSLNPHFHLSEMRELYIARSLYSFALGMIGVFIPIYLYETGFSFTLITAFFAVTYAAKTLTARFIDAPLIKKIGPKHMLSLSFVLSVIKIALLTAVESTAWLWPFAAAVWGVTLSIFWFASHVEFIKVRTAGRTTRQVGNTMLLVRTASSLAPLAGGLLATQFGIHVTFLVAMGLLVCAAIPLLSTSETVKIQYGVLEVPKLLSPSVRNVTLSLAARNVNMQVAAVLWPFYAFLFLGSYESVGGLVAFSVLLTLLVTRIVSLSGAHNAIQLKIGTIGTAAVNAVRWTVSSLGGLYLIGVLGDMFHVLQDIPYTAELYRGADDSSNLLGYVVAFEVAAALGTVMIWTVLLVLSLYLSMNALLVVAFWLAGFATLLTPLILRRVN